MPLGRDLPPDPLSGELDEFIANHHLHRRAAELDREPAFPRSEFAAMGGAGWLGLVTPAGAGGRGLSLPRAGALLHRLAYRSGTVFAKLSLQPEFSSVLREVGSPALRSGWFLPLCRGERLVGNHLTEPTAGSDVHSIALTATKDGGEYVLNGIKSEAAFAEDADAAIVYGQVGGGATGGITAFLVPQRLPGVHRQLTPRDLGEHWQRRGSVRYTNVRLSESFRLGEEGKGLEYVRPELTRERALLAAIYLGVARASWDETVGHVGERRAFGRPLSSQQAVAFPLVEDGARLNATWLYVAQTLDRLERGMDAEGDAALAKWMATEVALTTIDHAMQFHGGRGYSSELPHEQRWRDVRSGAIAHGPSEVMHVVAARTLWPRSPPSRPDTSMSHER